MKKLLIIILLLGIALSDAAGQTRTIQGKIIYDRLQPLSGAEILINDSVRVGISDLNGNVMVELDPGSQKIKLRAIGCDVLFISLNETCDYLEIVMTMRPTACFDSPRKGEKQRKKRFMDVTEKYRSAYEKGIFQTSSPCYERLYFKE